MTRAVAGLLAAVLTLGACGNTYIDSEVTVPDTAPAVIEMMGPCVVS